MGSALVKVNLGVAQPHDLKIVAGFLKGSGFIAKADHLSKLIEYLHVDEDEEKRRGSGTNATRTIAVDEEFVKELREYDEDGEVTAKEHKDKIDHSD